MYRHITKFGIFKICIHISNSCFLYWHFMSMDNLIGYFLAGRKGREK